ncbi:PTS system, glucose-like IIB component [Aerococcus suis]|uniref:PTS system, glucose-like IIB component n=1 Tax=Aerococcus suis TaxID=371602 RepID=A0A1W1YUI5_9LACT|nr:PTS system, glucose-like IIB component [Aerococcus suis]
MVEEFKHDAKALLSHVGGSENIQAVTHCATRMRFALKDPKQADAKAIEELKSVKGTFTQSGQFQVIIGNKVADFYNEFEKVSGVSGTSKADVKEAAAANNQN